METITITFENGDKKEYNKGIKLIDVISSIYGENNTDIIAGKYNNRIINKNDSLVKNGKLEILTINDRTGNKIYERGLTFLFTISVKEVLGKKISVKIRHSIDKGIFFEIDAELNEDILKQIKSKMKEYIDKEVAFSEIEVSRLEAINYFKKIGREDKAKTLFYITSDFIKLYKFAGYYNYIIGELPTDCSILKQFELTLIENKGIVLRFPSIYDNGKIVKYSHHQEYFNSLEQYSQWSKILNISNIGELNDALINRKPGEIIKLTEIMQDYQLLSLAEKIVLNKDDIKMILISGPSCSGKTTTARKLGLYLKALGLNPRDLSIDDYFLNRSETPLDEEGNYDYENVKAIDIDLFNSHINKLLKGEKVILPRYDFIEGKKEFKNPMQLGDKDILIIEGLHALNNVLSSSVSNKNKYKIYISPLAYINIDDDNRINLTDIRLLRRMVRDNRTRGYKPADTLNIWPSVRMGEEKYVFPYQDSADVIFNTFFAYELSVMKTYLEPLLFSVKEDNPKYLSALELIELLGFVLPIPGDDVPDMSILREFIGKSYF